MTITGLARGPTHLTELIPFLLKLWSGSLFLTHYCPPSFEDRNLNGSTHALPHEILHACSLLPHPVILCLDSHALVIARSFDGNVEVYDPAFPRGLTLAEATTLGCFQAKQWNALSCYPLQTPHLTGTRITSAFDTPLHALPLTLYGPPPHAPPAHAS